MTTDTASPGVADARRTSAGVVVRAAAALVVAGLVVVVLGASTSGSSAAVGALVGTVITAVVLVTGVMVVDVVAGLVPRASLMIALLTYLLQVVVLALVLVALASTPGVAEQVAPPWFAGAVIAAALVWTVGQVVLAMRVRIPAYDLPASAPQAAPTGSAEGSDR